MEALGNKKCKVENNTEDQKKCSRVKNKEKFNMVHQNRLLP